MLASIGHTSSQTQGDQLQNACYNYLLIHKNPYIVMSIIWENLYKLECIKKHANACTADVTIRPYISL